MNPRADARALVEPILSALDPGRAVQRHLATSPPPPAYRLVAIGKAAAGMARGAVATWGTPEAGVVLTVDGADTSDLELETYAAGHPIPDERGLVATRAVQRCVADSGVPLLFLISGGGSALLVAPRPPATLASIAEQTRKMLADGWPIETINRWRADHSLVKDGRLVRDVAVPIRTLVVRDLDGPLERVASGPTAGAPLEEVLGPADAVRAAARAAEALGYAVQTAPFATGDVAGLAASLLDGRRPRTAWIRSAEPTVTLTGTGRGGRNQQLALDAALQHAGRPGWALLALGTDGIDGPTDAAGAVVDGTTAAAGAAAALADNDAHPFLDRRGALIRTGPTGTNVTDLHVVLTDATFQP